MNEDSDIQTTSSKTVEEKIQRDEPEGAQPSAHAAQDGANGEVCPETLRANILQHIEYMGLVSADGNGSATLSSKESIRAAHAYQRTCYMDREVRMLGHRWPSLMEHFAEGHEVDPAAIDPELVPVESDKESGHLFRLATTLWSAPVSRGFGRRMRYLVRDQSNGKLIGIFALGDPVFNLRARDEWIGWDQAHRRKRLTSVMDAYVVGAVPPYSQLLGGKLVASLIGSREVSEAFHEKYGDTTGIISGAQKHAQLALVTVTSALGRSSIYNRLNLRQQPFNASSPTLVKLESIGKTRGYGHFHLPDELFAQLRQLIAQDHHAYADGYEFGSGPNWRLRVARVGLQRLGLDSNLVRHGIQREVYAMPLVKNFREVLQGTADHAVTDLSSVDTLSSTALERWVLPRAATRPEFSEARKETYLAEHLEMLAGGENLF